MKDKKTLTLHLLDKLIEMLADSHGTKEFEAIADTIDYIINKGTKERWWLA